MDEVLEERVLDEVVLVVVVVVVLAVDEEDTLEAAMLRSIEVELFRLVDMDECFICCKYSSL